MANHEGGVHFWTVSSTQFSYLTIKRIFPFQFVYTRGLNFILIRCSCSKINNNDRSTCIPLSVKWDYPVYGSSKYYLGVMIMPNNSGILGVNNFDR